MTSNTDYYCSHKKYTNKGYDKKASENPENSAKRRCKIDIWRKFLIFFNFLSWILIAAIFIVFERARPQFESFFDRFYKLKLRVNWDIKFVDYLLWLVAVCIFISASGVLLSLVRARRKEDYNIYGLVAMGLLSLGFLIGVEVFLL